jgi:hypothetical protein
MPFQIAPINGEIAMIATVKRGSWPRGWVYIDSWGPRTDGDARERGDPSVTFSFTGIVGGTGLSPSAGRKIKKGQRVTRIFVIDGDGPFMRMPRRQVDGRGVVVKSYWLNAFSLEVCLGTAVL